MAVTPFQLIEPFSMDSFNSRISEINTMFGGLGNEYVWAKVTTETNIVYTETYEANGNVFSPSSASNQSTFYYADSISVSGSNAVLINPKTVTVTTANADDLQVLKGKYYNIGTSNSIVMYYIPADGTITVSNNGWNVTATLYRRTSFAEQTTITNYGYVNSPDPNAYPPSVPDGYTYTALGQFGAKVQMATGSYTGTGTYGSSNPNSITFDFRPKFLALFDASGFLVQLGSQSNRAIASLMNLTESYQDNVLWSWLYNNNYTNAKFDSATNTLNWYHGAGAEYQLNNSGTVYNYIAIG